MLDSGLDRHRQALGNLLRQILLHLLHQLCLGVLVRDDMVHGCRVRRRHDTGIVCVQEPVERLGDRSQGPAQPVREGQGQGQSVDGCHERDLDTADQRLDRTRHGLIAGRIESAKTKDQAHEGSQNAEARQDIRDHLDKAAVCVVVDLILTDIIADVGRTVCLMEK